MVSPRYTTHTVWGGRRPKVATKESTTRTTGRSKTRVISIPVKDLTVDPAYQRIVDKSRVNRMAKKFDPQGLGVIEVAEREDGTRVLLDGQHRVETVRTKVEEGDIDGNFKIAARVHSGMSPAEEAALFATLQEQKPLTPLQKFRAMLASDNPEYVEMAKVLKKHGLQVAIGPKPGHVQAADAVIGVYNQYEAAGLDEVCAILVEAWGNDSANFQSQILRGFAYFLNHAENLDRERLVKQISKITPAQLLAFSRRFSGTMSANLKVRDVAEGIRQTYNRGLRKETLKVGPMQLAA